MAAESEHKALVVFVLGGPGAGKGTQCGKISDEFGFVHLSAGDLLRRERSTEGSEHGELISKYIVEGKIVPVEITVSLLLNEMKANVAENRKKFLIDGFPRNQDNLDGWYKVVGAYAKVAFCLFLDCPEEVMEKRLLSRGKSSGRSDDNIESIRKRFKTYQESTRPILDIFAGKDKCQRVECDRSIPEIFDEIKKLFANL